MDLRCFTLLWILFISSAPLAESQPPAVKPRYKKFLDQHVYDKMNEHECTSVISRRRISEGNSNKCKEVNTFLKANTNQVNAVCADAGSLRPGSRDLYESTVAFSVITCKLRRGERHPNCDYRGVKSTRYITVACDQGWPVHYEEDVITG